MIGMLQVFDDAITSFCTNLLLFGKVFAATAAGIAATVLMTVRDLLGSLASALQRSAHVAV
jgi:hypothetical protein